jgi:hypothetical protein
LMADEESSEQDGDAKKAKEDLPQAATSVVKKETDKVDPKKDQTKEDNQNAPDAKKTQSELERLKSINESHDDQDMMSNIVDIN